MTTSQYTPLELDALYNNRALVPEHAQHFERWRIESAQARASHRVFEDVVYGQGPMESLDFFVADQPQAPIVIFLHGGYWRSLDKADHSFLAPMFLQQGAHVVIPNYALCPAVTIPQIVMQMVKCVTWVARNAARFGADASRISLIGHSAGGHLVSMLLACDWQAYAPDLPSTLVRKGLSISGLYELTTISQVPFLKDSLRLTPQDARKASPALLPTPQGVTLYTVTGALESSEFLRHNQLMQQAWGTQTVPVAHVLEGEQHFSVLEAMTRPGDYLHQLALKLI